MDSIIIYILGYISGLVWIIPAYYHGKVKAFEECMKITKKALEETFE